MKSGTELAEDATRKVPIFQLLAVCTGALNFMCCGMHFGWTSVSFPKLLVHDSPIPMTDDEGSWVAVMYLIGILCGSNVGAVTVDVVGRRNLVLLTALPFFSSWMMLGYAQSVAILIAGRFIGGVCDGLTICTLPMYIGEIADPNIRGFLSCWISIIWLAGILVMNIMGSYLDLTTTAIIASIVPLLMLVTFSWMPESPYYLIMKGKIHQAKQCLQVFKGTQDVDQELTRLTQVVQEQNANTGRFLDLFTVKGNRMALFVATITRTTQQCSGVTAIMFYAQIVFKDAGDAISPSVASIIYFGMQLMVSVLASSIVDRTGRRPLLIISVIGATIALLIEGCYFYLQTKTDIDTTSFAIVPVIALIAFILTYGVGLQAIPIVLMGEVFPTNVKAFALCVCNSYFAILAAILSKFFQFTKDKFGLHVPFFAFTICCVFGLIFMAIFVPETKGKTLEQIQLELAGEDAEYSVPKSKGEVKRITDA